MSSLRSRLRPWGVLIAILGLVVAFRVSRVYEPGSFLIGDCPFYAATALSVLQDGDLDLRNQLTGSVPFGQISLGARGEWYPKHPILMPMATLPLVPWLGMDGFLVFNILVLLGFGLLLYELSRLAAGSTAAVIAALAVILGSFAIRYDYNYSPDLFACLLLTGGVYALLRRRLGLAGLLVGLAVAARTSNLFLTPVILGFALWRSGWRGGLRLGLALALPLVAQAGLNAHMFGSPLVSPYMRILVMGPDGPTLTSHVGDFDHPFWEGLLGQLFDRDHGLLYTAPVLLLALPGFVLWFRRRPEHAALCLVLAEFLILIFSKYQLWSMSHYGNRFLFPVLAFSAPAVACLLEAALRRLPSSRRPLDAEMGPAIVP